MWYFRAVAFDLDGTLATGDAVDRSLLDALDTARAQRRLILVTGRVEADLARVFPTLAEHFDAVVTENGAVLAAGATNRLLHPPVDDAVDKALADRGIGSSRGQVLVALNGRDAAAASEVIAELGLDCQLVHNRGAAMILPAGVTKGTGLCAALDELGLSPHNSVAIGDAENDLALLREAEVGVAVANAVTSLREHADLVAGAADGAAVTDLLAGNLLAGRERFCPERRRVPIGQFEDGSLALVPGSQASLLIRGESGAGKSYLAGLLAERWIDAGYSVMVVDPEGDHLALAERPGVHVVDAAAHLPSPSDLMGSARPKHASIVIDLSGISAEDRLAYLRRLPTAIAAERRRYGSPHWVIFDEAHEPVWLDSDNAIAATLAEAGTCLVTWRPDALPEAITRAVDITVTVTGQLSPGATREAVYAELQAGAGPARRVCLAERISHHVRHRRKYATTPLPPHRRFYFHGEPAAVAATIEQFARHLRHCDLDTIAYHLEREDFSRWIEHTLTDHALAAELAAVERNLATARAGALEQARQEALAALNRRYLEHE